MATKAAIAESGGEGDDLAAAFRRLFVGLRWLMVAAQTAMSLLLIALKPQTITTYGALTALLWYNAVTLVIVIRRGKRRYAGPVSERFLLLLLQGDLASVFGAAYFTGASNSPFLGQCYLIIFIGALYFGVRGGLAVATASVALTALLVCVHPAGLWEDLRDLVPYFLVTGAFTGFLSDGLRGWFARYAESERAGRERDLAIQFARSEMDLARRTQDAALPLHPPEISGIDCAVRANAARDLGGDLFLFLQDDTGQRLQLVVGDVSGKGVPAALTATSIAHLLPWLAPLDDPATALFRLNQDLEERLMSSAFVTMALADVDARSGSVRLYCAGHPPALVWRHQFRTVSALEAPNVPLGILPDWSGEAIRLTLEPGDMLLLYSDGLTETRRAADREMLDTEGLADALTTILGSAIGDSLSADETAAALWARVEAWGEQNDDRTLVVCRYVGPGVIPLNPERLPASVGRTGIISV